MAQWIDMQGSNINERSQLMLEDLRERVVDEAQKNSLWIRSYLPEWRGPIESNLSHYKQYLCDFLHDFTIAASKSIFEIAQNTLHQQDNVFSEVLAHLHFMNTKCGQFIENESVGSAIGQITSYLTASKQESPPFTVWGISGCGKTSLIAYPQYHNSFLFIF